MLEPRALVCHFLAVGGTAEKPAYIAHVLQYHPEQEQFLLGLAVLEGQSEALGHRYGFSRRYVIEGSPFPERLLKPVPVRVVLDSLAIGTTIDLGPLVDRRGRPIEDPEKAAIVRRQRIYGLQQELKQLAQAGKDRRSSRVRRLQQELDVLLTAR